MKKLLLTAAILLTGISIYAQGVVLFANTTTTTVRTNVGGVSGPIPAGTAFMLNLYYAPDGPQPAPSALTPLGAPVGFISPGRFNGGNRTTPNTTAPGDFAWFDVRVWESAFGSSYEAAVAAPAMNVGGTTRPTMAGKSGAFRIQTGTAAGSLPITQTGGFAGIPNVDIVPEPSVIALGILGLTGLLVLRRRRS